MEGALRTHRQRGHAVTGSRPGRCSQPLTHRSPRMPLCGPRMLWGFHHGHKRRIPGFRPPRAQYLPWTPDLAAPSTLLCILRGVWEAHLDETTLTSLRDCPLPQLSHGERRWHRAFCRQTGSPSLPNQPVSSRDFYSRGLTATGEEEGAELWPQGARDALASGDGERAARCCEPGPTLWFIVLFRTLSSQSARPTQGQM